MPDSPLAEPLTLPSGLRLSNRIVKAPMTENLADADNQPTERHVRVYERWAAGGAGLLITGNLMVDRRYLERSRNIVADRHLDVGALRKVAEATGDVPVVAQLNHPGRQCNRFVTSSPVGPSTGEAVSLFGLFGLYARPRALATAEIEQLIEAFASAAAQCEEAGFDGVQVHAAHGYLLAQFLSPATNARTDEWGGDISGRARALLEAVRAAKAATSPGFSVSVKLNSSDFRRGGITEDDAEQVVRMLAEEGIDFLEVSGGTYESPALFGLADGQSDAADGQSPFKEAYFAAFAKRAKAAAPDVPIMLTGGLRTRAAMEALVESGAVDLIGLARPLALDPDVAGALVAGTTDGIDLPAYDVPKLFELAGESEWYETQIARMGDGEEPDPGLHPIKAASTFIVGEAVRGLSARRRRAALARQA